MMSAGVHSKTKHILARTSESIFSTVPLYHLLITSKRVFVARAKALRLIHLFSIIVTMHIDVSLTGDWEHDTIIEKY